MEFLSKILETVAAFALVVFVLFLMRLMGGYIGLIKLREEARHQQRKAMRNKESNTETENCEGETDQYRPNSDNA